MICAWNVDIRLVTPRVRTMTRNRSILARAIVEGEEYYELNDEYYCTWCFEDNAVEILMNECGASKGVADADI